MNASAFRKKLRPMTLDGSEGLILDTEDEVVRVGYRSVTDQINELTRAGIKLQLDREMRYSEPSPITPRLYGEIDITIARDKIQASKERVINRYKEKAEKQEQERLAAEEKKSQQEATKTPPAEGGVT